MQQAEYKDPKPVKVKKGGKPPREHRMSKGSRILLTIVCIVVGIALVLGGDGVRPRPHRPRRADR